MESSAFKVAAKAVKLAVGEQTVREQLVKRLTVKLKEVPGAPAVGWKLRRQLMNLLKDKDAEGALMDQDQQGAEALSAMIASRVLRTDPSAESLIIAQALMTEYPGALGIQEAFSGLYYKVRRMDESINAQFERVLGAIDQSGQTPRQIDPDILLAGPLQGLELTDQQRTAEQLASSDPIAAAAILAGLIQELERAGYGPLAEPLHIQRAQLLTGAGQFAAADSEWLPFVERFLVSGAGRSADRAVSAFSALAKREDAPPWLHPRAIAVSALENWIIGDSESDIAIAAAIAASEAGDPAAALWLSIATEGAMALGDKHLVADVSEQLRQVASSCSDANLRIRLRLVAAEVADDEQLWASLLSDAAPGSGRCSLPDSALIHARRGRYLFWSDQSEAAAAEFRFGVERGCRAQIWDDAAAWCRSIITTHSRASEVNITEMDDLRQQIRAISASGRGALRVQAYDPEVAALRALLEAAAGRKRPRAARAELRRYLRDSVASAHLVDEIQAHLLLGRMYQQSGHLDRAVGHCIVAGNAGDCREIAAQLHGYFDCRGESRSLQFQRRAAAFGAAAGEADLIPDDLVNDWATSAVAEAIQHDGRPFGAEVWLEAYKLLAGLAIRLPNELVDQLFSDIDRLLPRGAHQYTLADDQIVGILIGLCAGKPERHAQIAERVALAFEVADEIASKLVEHFDVLEPVFRFIEKRLQALVGPLEAGNVARVENATKVLVRLGNRSTEVIASAGSLVARELASPPTYSANHMSRVEGGSDTATIATCLSSDRQIALAWHFCNHALDENDSEENRAHFAAACVPLAETLPTDTRDELFDSLFRLAVGSGEPASQFDEWERRLGDPFAPFHIERVPGQLRRQVIMTLTMLAADSQRQRLVWHAAQLLMRTGESRDALAFARASYQLNRFGFSIELPWRTMALSGDPEMRLLAATVFPTSTEEMDFEAIESLARDPDTDVRIVLAESLAARGHLGSVGIEELTKILQTDLSYRVRRKLQVGGNSAS
ncbi:hypothetical protein [Mycobacteroides abscessus]|uniref:hypothetical protein n=1 Tax=Mycobacteroides abscessus TaxID=36809 RepID=UPI00105126F3|nr:hypothetical protein [Mycobacteroides abscessus]